MNLLFPMAFGVNFFAMTGLMVYLSIIGKSELAADIAIVQASTSALFYAFSGNARSLILNKKSLITADDIYSIRCALILPLSVVSAFLSVSVSNVAWIFAVFLVLRRGAEWLTDVYISESEIEQKHHNAKTYIILQSITLFIVFVSIHTSYFYISLLLWSISPLINGAEYFIKKSSISLFNNFQLTKLLPHIGSTAVIGIGVYVFRLVILSLVDKPVAGDLFAAFAIGGFLASIFVQAIGPTLIANNTFNNKSSPSKYFHLFNSIFAVMGIVVIIISWNYFDVLVMGKNRIFFEAIGFSLIGGALMIYAQYSRLKILQEYDNSNVYGPDVLINILFIASVPFLTYIFGIKVLPSLFLISSVINYIFYSFYHFRISKNMERIIPYFSNKIIIYFISGLIFIPIFLQINSCIYDNCIFNDKSILYDTKGLLFNLPIPLSMFACVLGIILFNNYKKSKISLTTVLMLFVLMVISTVITTNSNISTQQAKMILIMQFTIPAIALILGQLMYTELTDLKLIARPFIIIISILVPSQLLLSWLDEKLLLVSHLYLFSFYQHIQYGGVIVVSAYIFSLFTLYEERKYRKYLLILMPLVGIFAIASISGLTIALYLFGISVFILYQFKTVFNRNLLSVAVISIVCVSGYFIYAVNNSDAYQSIYQSKIIKNIHTQNHSYYWKYYISGVLKNYKTVLFGQEERPDRKEYPSAHNYYLDFIYSFGVLALIPLLILISYTLMIVFKCRREIYTSPSLLGLVISVLFLILIDNSLKVGLRQPYPGIVSFFLWGILISKLTDTYNSLGSEPSKI